VSVEQEGLADRSSRERRAGGGRRAGEDPVLPHHRGSIRLPGRAHHRLRIFEPRRHRLLDDDVLAGGECGDRLLRME